MTAYIIRRILLVIPILFIVAVTTFFITNVIPGDPVRLILGDFASEIQVAQLRSELGWDKPLYVRFFLWVTRLLRGDLGQSLFLHVPVTQAIYTRMEPTIVLAILGQTIAVLIGIPLGVLAASNHRRILDQIAVFLAIGGVSIPSFWLAISLMLLFSVTLGWFPVAGYQSIGEAGFSSLRYLVLPSISIGVMQSALLARITRSAMLDVLTQDYVRTAKAKGLQRYRILGKHALRNASIPIVTILGSSFSQLLAGTWIIETVYSIPGTGALAITAIMRRDYPLIQGSIIFIALIYVLINLVIDISYALLDPRVKME